jgi:hypothetical protein
MSGSRRDFLGRLAVGATAAAGGLGLAPTAAVAADLPPPVTDKWDVAWAGRLTGRARAVFDSPEIQDGGGLFRAVLWMDQNREVYGLKDEEMSTVLVIRHAAIVMVASDAYQALTRARSRRSPTGRSTPAKHNHSSSTSRREATGGLALLARGVRLAGGSCWPATWPGQMVHSVGSRKSPGAEA